MAVEPRNLFCEANGEACSDTRCKKGLCMAMAEEPRFIDPSHAYARRQAEEIDREAVQVAMSALQRRGIKATPDQVKQAAALPKVRQIAADNVLAREKRALEPLSPDIHELFRDLPSKTRA